MTSNSPARAAFNGVTRPKADALVPYNPDTDPKDYWRMLSPRYTRWIKDGLVLRDQKIQDLLAYNNGLGEAILSNGNTRVRSGVAQAKGGGAKSPVIASTASATVVCSKRNTLVIDNNQAMGNVATFLGIPKEGGMTTRQCAELTRQGKLDNSADFNIMIPSSRYGVMLLVSDKVVEQNDLYGRDVAMSNMTLSQKHFPLIFNDTGNGVQDPATGGVWDMLNVLMLPSLTRDSHIELSSETRELLYSWQKPDNNYAYLIENGIQVVVGLKPGEVLESYRERLGLPEDRLLFAHPYDERMALDKPVNFELSSLYYEIACREVALVNLLVARNQAMTARDRLALRTGQLVTLESGRTPVLPWIDGSQPITNIDQERSVR